MSTQHRLIAFEHPLSGASIVGHAVKRYTESDLAAAKEAAYREGYDAAHAFSDQQMLEFRNEVQSLQVGLFQSLPTIEQSMMEQLRSELPGLALDLARRLMAGFEPSDELIEKICSETLEQLFPERENLEVIVCPQDAAVLQKHITDMESRYPGLRMRADATLQTGDCQVRSRFGLTDARMSAKLESIRHELVGAA